MKKLSSIFVAGMVLVGGVAQADYQCTTVDNKVSMTVKNFQTRLGNTIVTLNSQDGTSSYVGSSHSEGGGIFKKSTVELYPYEGDVLTIVSRPSKCGRGGCDKFSSPFVSANLKIGETQTQFTCYEIAD